ncbi:MAG: hypothetical protein ABI670_11120 [Chloroflexota bacterium]
MKKRLVYLLLLLPVLLIATGCLGPKPILDSYTAEPPQAGSNDPFRVDAVIRNGGPGDGQVEVEVTLVNKQTGVVIRKSSSEVNLKKDETQHVLFELNMPPSSKDLNPDDIQVEIDAHYPIE